MRKGQIRMGIAERENTLVKLYTRMRWLRAEHHREHKTLDYCSDCERCCVSLEKKEKKSQVC